MRSTAGGWAVGVLANDLARASTHSGEQGCAARGKARTRLAVRSRGRIRRWPRDGEEPPHLRPRGGSPGSGCSGWQGRYLGWGGSAAWTGFRQYGLCALDVGRLRRARCIESLVELYHGRILRYPEEFGWALDQGVVETPVSGEQRPLVAATAPSTLAEPRRLAAAWQSSDSGEGLGGVKDRNLADELWRAVRIAAWRACREATQLKAAASQFGSTEPQAKEWCARLVAEGELRLEQRPVRYVASEAPRGKDLGDALLQSRSVTPGDELWRVIRDLVVRALGEPRSSVEVAVELHVMPRQAQAWLKRLAEEGALERRERPVRYVARSAGLLDGVRPLSDRD